MKKTYFVTGTDIDVGKTIAIQSLLQAFNRRGLTTVGYKPISTDPEYTPDGMKSADALHLQSIASQAVDYAQVTPIALSETAAPCIAASLEHRSIDTDLMSKTLHHHQASAEVVLVEGSGGWRAPIGEDQCLSGWVADEKLPVILVVGIKPGCLNQTLLTLEAIERDGVEIVGWIANRIHPGERNYPQIIEFLEQRINAPKIGEIPYVAGIMKKEINHFVELNAFV